jgi:hypothetical protein
VKLVRHDEEACRPHPVAPPEFNIALSVTANWSREVLRGRATLGRDHNVPVLRYGVQGKASGKDLAPLLPCAVTDDNVSVALEGGVHGGNRSQRDRGRLTFYFSCEDVAVRCSTE